MKRLWIAVILLAVVTGLCITNFFILKNMTGDMDEILHQALMAAENRDKESVLRYTNEFETKWRSCYPFYSIFLRHQEIHDMELKMTGMQVVAKEGDFEEFKRFCAEEISLLNEIFTMQKPSLHNIF